MTDRQEGTSSPRPRIRAAGTKQDNAAYAYVLVTGELVVRIIERGQGTSPA